MSIGASRPCDGCQKSYHVHESKEPTTCKVCKVPVFYSLACFNQNRDHKYMCLKGMKLLSMSERRARLLSLFSSSGAESPVDATARRIYATSAYYLYGGPRYSSKQAYGHLRATLNPCDPKEQKKVHLLLLFPNYIDHKGKQFHAGMHPKIFFRSLLDQLAQIVGISKHEALLALASWMGENRTSFHESWEQAVLASFNEAGKAAHFKSLIDQAESNKQYLTVLN